MLAENNVAPTSCQVSVRGNTNLDRVALNRPRNPIEPAANADVALNNAVNIKAAVIRVEREIPNPCSVAAPRASLPIPREAQILTAVNAIASRIKVVADSLVCRLSEPKAQSAIDRSRESGTTKLAIPSSANAKAPNATPMTAKSVVTGPRV